jgi:hypothetical protein
MRFSMSVEAVSSINQVTVYVRLLGEGTEVFRPSPAVALGEGVFRLIQPGDYDPEDEEWEFVPDSLVKTALCQGTSGTYLVATSLAK